MVRLCAVAHLTASAESRKVALLADVGDRQRSADLNHPEDRHEAADALRGLIERIVLKPGPKPRPT